MEKIVISTKEKSITVTEEEFNKFREYMAGLLPDNFLIYFKRILSAEAQHYWTDEDFRHYCNGVKAYMGKISNNEKEIVKFIYEPVPQTVSLNLIKILVDYSKNKDDNNTNQIISFFIEALASKRKIDVKYEK